MASATAMVLREDEVCRPCAAKDHPHIPAHMDEPAVRFRSLRCPAPEDGSLGASTEPAPQAAGQLTLSEGPSGGERAEAVARSDRGQAPGECPQPPAVAVASYLDSLTWGSLCFACEAGRLRPLEAEPLTLECPECGASVQQSLAA